MATIKLAILKSKPSKDGYYKIRVAVGHCQQTTYILTNVAVRLNEWDGSSVVNRMDAASLNIQLTQVLLEYRSRLLKVQSIERLTCQQLRDTLLNMRSSADVYFTEYANEYLNELLLDDRKSTYTLAKYVVDLFVEFLNGDILLSSLTPTHISSFDRALKKRGMSDTTIGMYLVTIRTIINKAIRLQIVKYDVHPFIMWRRPQSPVRELDISIDELRMLIAYKPVGKNEVMAKNLFLLSYYLCGINLIDMLSLRYTSSRIEYVRKKSSRTKHGDMVTSFTIQQEARDILSTITDKEGCIMYEGSVSSIRDKVNKALKRIGIKIGIRGRFCYYSARKSFVQHGFDIGIPLEVLEYCIGQSVKNNRPIFNYVKIMRKHADIAIRTILDKVNEEH